METAKIKHHVLFCLSSTSFYFPNSRNFLRFYNRSPMYIPHGLLVHGLINKLNNKIYFFLWPVILPVWEEDHGREYLKNLVDEDVCVSVYSFKKNRFTYVRVREPEKHLARKSLFCIFTITDYRKLTCSVGYLFIIIVDLIFVNKIHDTMTKFWITIINIIQVTKINRYLLILPHKTFVNWIISALKIEMRTYPPLLFLPKQYSTFPLLRFSFVLQHEF